MSTIARNAQVAQSVEQRTENPRVGGSIPPLGTTLPPKHFYIFLNQTTASIGYIKISRQSPSLKIVRSSGPYSRAA